MTPPTPDAGDAAAWVTMFRLAGWAAIAVGWASRDDCNEQARPWHCNALDTEYYPAVRKKSLGLG